MYTDVQGYGCGTAYSLSQNDTEYVRRILEYIDAADMRDKVIFMVGAQVKEKRIFIK